MIIGRLEGSLTAAQVLYPLMQCTDVFFLKADICQLGVDQRKVNMLAREYCDAAKRRHKPVILSHHMLYGLKEGQEKMSKSDPDSAVFMEDTKEDVERKIARAYCPTREKEDTAAEDGAAIDTAAEGKQAGDKAADAKAADAGKESMHLTKDNLKNPILDYVQNIVLSPPGATFTCATATAPDGHTYDDYAAVKEDFLKGDITPAQLKRGLIDALNELLEPVRDHFANNETAKELFAQVKEFKKQSAAGPVETSQEDVPKVFRLDLVEQGVVPAASHLVLAPLPSSTPTLQSAADILAKLTAAPDNAPVVLLLRDWTARVNSALDADPKLIAAYYAVLLSSLRALDVHFHGAAGSVMPHVTVVLQSEAILKDPSSYWISVINAGRHFTLDAVMGANIGLGAGMRDAEGVGKVIGRLMLVADVLAVNPRSLALDAAVAAPAAETAGEDVAAGVGGLTLEGDAGGGAASALAPPPRSVEAHLVQQFYATQLSHPGLAAVLPPPRIAHATGGPTLALQPPRESAGHRLESDEYFLADDPKVHGKSKMKKAFCEPGNVGFCPPIELLAYFGGLSDSDGIGGGEGGTDEQEGGGGGVTVSRSPENGGTVTYTSKAALLGDFALGALHPGDLKGAAATMMVEVLTAMSGERKGDDAATKGVKALKAFEKKMAKQKKK